MTFKRVLDFSQSYKKLNDPRIHCSNLDRAQVRQIREMRRNTTRQGQKKGQPRGGRSLEDLAAYLATWRINKCGALYAVTRNGTHALTAYRLAREAHLSIPDWVLTYFDGAIVALGTGPKTIKAVADAFGLGAKGGPFATNKALKDWRNLDVIQSVDHFKATDPQTLDPALSRELELNGPFWVVGQRMTPKLSVERVQEIYYEAFKDFSK